MEEMNGKRSGNSGRDLIEGGRYRDDHDQYIDMKEFGNCER